ncbi:MAG: peptidoglycan editing factor PgeF [Pseudomonadales bacterium]|nr:peptidoglycan editing factor PgeF [Pseudomonadales bacterium]
MRDADVKGDIESDESGFIVPVWPAPAYVSALVTTRSGGVSSSPYESFNLGDHVGDNERAVAQNRTRLSVLSGLPSKRVRWLSQVHSDRVLEYRAIADAGPEKAAEEADGAVTSCLNLACVVMTADCLPVLLCNQQGTRVAAVHAGWRGLLAGILENAVRCFDSGDQLLAWLGPAIGPNCFEVGPAVFDPFTQQSAAARSAFTAIESSAKAQGERKWLADIYTLARIRLNQTGVFDVYGGDFCTVTEADRFFSFRRDGVTGRMASMIWLTE